MNLAEELEDLASVLRMPVLDPENESRHAVGTGVALRVAELMGTAAEILDERLPAWDAPEVSHDGRASGVYVRSALHTSQSSHQISLTAFHQHDAAGSVVDPSG